jgi:hypothetical protein
LLSTGKKETRLLFSSHMFRKASLSKGTEALLLPNWAWGGGTSKKKPMKGTTL